MFHFSANHSPVDSSGIFISSSQSIGSISRSSIHWFKTDTNLTMNVAFRFWQTFTLLYSVAHGMDWHQSLIDHVQRKVFENSRTKLLTFFSPSLLSPPSSAILASWLAHLICPLVAFFKLPRKWGYHALPGVLVLTKLISINDWCQSIPWATL